MFKFLSLKRKHEITQQSQCVLPQIESSYIKIRNVYYNFIYVLDKNYEEKFFKANPEELIGCRPIAKNGAVQKVKTIFFKRNDLQIIS